MAHAMTLASTTVPIAPHAYVSLPAKEKVDFDYNCPNGVCLTRFHDRVFLYTPTKGQSTWHYWFTYSPLFLVGFLALALVVWLAITCHWRYKAYEDALQQRLCDAISEEEREIDV